MRKISQGMNSICILQTKFLLRLVKDGTIVHIMAPKNSNVENLSTRHARKTKNTSIISSCSPINGQWKILARKASVYKKTYAKYMHKKHVCCHRLTMKNTCTKSKCIQKTYAKYMHKKYVCCHRLTMKNTYTKSKCIRKTYVKYMHKKHVYCHQLTTEKTCIRSMCIVVNWRWKTLALETCVIYE